MVTTSLFFTRSLTLIVVAVENGIQDEQSLLRDLNKAWIGFSSIGDIKTVATGNWGCGVFGTNNFCYVLKLVLFKTFHFC
jgi:hypothetical protein